MISSPPAKLDDIDSARLLLRIDSGQSPPKNITSILSGDWLDGATVGMTGHDSWLAAIEARNASRAAEIRTAIEAAKVDPGDLSDGHQANTDRLRLAPGTIVKPIDRNNIGTIDYDRGHEIVVHFISPGGVSATRSFAPHELRLLDGSTLDSTAESTLSEPFDLKVLGTSVFMRSDFRREWLIRKVLVKGRAGVIGGPQKCMKTSITVDLLISLACSARFFGSFDVPRKTKVLLISGESGAAVVQETCRRVCRSKGINPDEMDGFAFWGFDLPRLDSPEQLGSLAKFIKENEIEVVILDPLYLCLLTGGQSIDPANLFDVGPLLKKITTTCLDAGATPLLVHHFRKNRENPNGPPELEDLSFSGIQEFARQWLLVNRRERYEPGSGLHRLWFSVGGSDGHSGEWAVDISEGTVDEDFRDREWHVSIDRAADARDLQKQRLETAKAEKAKEKEQKKIEAEERKRCEAIEDALGVLRRSSDGLTKTKWRESIGCNSAKLNMIVSKLIEQGRIREGEVSVNGSGGKSWTDQGFIFVNAIIQETTPDNPGQPRTFSQSPIAGPGLDQPRTPTPDTPPLTGGVRGPSGVSRPDLGGTTADKLQPAENSPGLDGLTKGVA